jgi:hypothetical protein
MSQNGSGNFSSISSHGFARLTITSNTVYQLEYFCHSTDLGGTGGMHASSNDTDNTEEEIYTMLEIWKEN